MKTTDNPAVLHDDVTDATRPPGVPPALAEPARSRWRNPSKVHAARIKLLVANLAGGNDTHEITIEPGAEVSLPRHFDAAIAKVHEGQVVGGLCGWLQRVDPPEDGPRGWVRCELFAVPDHARAAPAVAPRPPHNVRIQGGRLVPVDPIEQGAPPRRLLED